MMMVFVSIWCFLLCKNKILKTDNLYYLAKMFIIYLGLRNQIFDNLKDLSFIREGRKN